MAESGTGHFTQVVWKSTKKIGIAKQTRMHGALKCTYIVARYSPEGNIHKDFEKNVEKGDFNETVCLELKRDLLKFQQRNEKFFPHVEGSLAKAHAAAMAHEKLMALMKMKAMGKQNKQKGGEKAKGTSKGQKTKDTKNGRKAKELIGSTTLKRPTSDAYFGRQYKISSSGRKLANQKPRFVTGVLNNGLKTIVEENHHLMHIGPTVKIVESNGGGGLMYKKIEGPPIARGVVLYNRPNQVRHQNGRSKTHLMTDGKIDEEVLQQESDEFSNPANLVESQKIFSQDPYKIPHTINPFQQVSQPLKRFRNRKWYSSPHLTTSTFDQETGRVMEKDYENVNGYIEEAPISHWNGVSRSVKQDLRKAPVQRAPMPSKITNRHTLNTFMHSKLGQYGGSRQIKATSNKLTLNRKPGRLIQSYNAKRLSQGYNAPKKVTKTLKWSPSRPPMIARKPVQPVPPHHIPASLMRILNGMHSSNVISPFGIRPKVMAKHPQEHKLPNSLLRILKGKSTNGVTKTIKSNPTAHPFVRQQPHKLPESLLRMMNAKLRSEQKKMTLGIKMKAPQSAMHSEHKIPESLQRILQAKKVIHSPTPNYVATKSLTEKPYSIMLNGHQVPYSLYKMLTAEVVSGKAPKVAKYLTEKPFTIVQNHPKMPKSLKRILKGRTEAVNAAEHAEDSFAKLENSLGPAAMKVNSKYRDAKRFGSKVGAVSAGWQHFQQPSYPQIESYAQQSAIQHPPASMFANAPQRAREQERQFNPAAFPTSVMATTRTTVAANFPETFTTTLSAAREPATAGVKGPSLANFESLGPSRDTKRVLAIPHGSAVRKTLNSYAPVSTDGQLISIDTKKDKEGKSMCSDLEYRMIGGVGINGGLENS